MLREIWFEVLIPVCMKDFAKQSMPVSITWIRSADKLLTLTLTLPGRLCLLVRQAS